jgi:O-antigen ligase
MAMMPAMIVLSYIFERWRWTRGLIVFGGIGMMNLLTVGVTGIKPVREFVQSLGIDATYTARSDIWELALNAIAARPLTGYGIGGFWQTDSLKHSGLAAYTWAVAAVDAHNGYVDAAINAGLPGLTLMIIWVLWLPQQNIQAAENANNFTPLTRLFLRIWLYGIFLACLESVFMARSGPIWFTICVAMFGLGFQARYSVINDRGNVPSNGRTYARVSSIRAGQRG